MDGINVVGVQFRRAGKLYDFSIGDLDLRVGDHVVVETDRGPSLAQVAMVKFAANEDLEGRTLKPILRKASQKELNKEGRLSPDYVSDFTKDKVKTLKLNMRVLKSEVQFGGNKVIVFFTAPGRVDFRELVKELAGGLKTRVELKQVGARDETKLIGGIGVCGREFCCSSFLREFVPVSIRMAKNQNLALNPSKVSGGCGRLLCCLTYEDEAYKELRKKIPPKGTRLRLLERGDYGDVIKGDLLNQMVYVETDEGQMITVKLSETEIVEKGTGEEAATSSWGDDLNLDELTEEMAHAMEDDASSGIDGDVDGDGNKQKRHGGQRGGGDQRKQRGPRPQRQQSGDRQGRSGGGGRNRNFKKGQQKKGKDGKVQGNDRGGAKPGGDNQGGGGNR